MRIRTHPVLLAGLASLTTPLALSAHAGHAGDHSWIAGATQPSLSPDHFLAGAFVALVIAFGVATLARITPRSDSRPTVEP
jgi:hydrogenase/urease accessory protein HupE